MPDGNIASVASKQRAIARLETKAIEETADAYIIRGMATTPRMDRMEDVVMPTGAMFDAMPKLFLYHDATLPIGTLTSLKPGAKGIPFEARIPKVVEPGVVKDRIDEAVHSIRYDLLSYVSIGFLPKEWEPVDPKQPYGGQRYLQWEFLELSVVGIPANSDAVITGIKSLDDEIRRDHAAHIKSIDSTRRAASGVNGVRVVSLSSPPGASGSNQSSKENDMKPIAEQIAALEAKRAATTASRNAVQQKAMDEGRTKNAAEKEEFDTLTAEVEAIDSELKDLRVMEKQNLTQLTAVVETQQQRAAATVEVPRTPTPVVTGMTSRLEPGQKMARWAMAQYRAKENRQDIATIIQANKEWMLTSPELLMVAKAAVAAGDTTTSGWASELVYNQNLAAEFINYLRPATIIGRIQGWRNAPFNIRVGSATGGLTGYWVGQGAAAPVSKMTTSSVTMGITKAVGLAAVDKELMMSSSPSAELLIRNDLAAAVQFLLDVSLIDPNQGGVANTQPAALTYGATTTQASGTAYSNLKTDVQATFAPFISANMDPTKGVWIMSPTTALALSMMVTSLGVPQFPGIDIKGGVLFGLPVVVSQSAYISGSPDYGNMIVLLFPSEVFLADDGQVNIEMSDQTAIQLLDNPTNLSTGGTTPTTLVSMFQTNSVAIKATRFINWKAARTNVAAVIRTAAYA